MNVRITRGGKVLGVPKDIRRRLETIPVNRPATERKQHEVYILTYGVVHTAGKDALPITEYKVTGCRKEMME